ncbi:CHAT domain-containing protein [Streptomyces canus]|uniref:CHAT domain-containing protein n=1 Tax=Streptomyces canus TaxID=58343 RepID=UPI003CE690B3
MPERERQLIERLVAANSVDDAERILRTESFAADALVDELVLRATSLEVRGRPAEAAFTRFFVTLVREASLPRGAVTNRRTAAADRRPSAPPRPTALPSPRVGPAAREDDPREALEKDAALMLDRGDLTGAVAAFRRADELPQMLLEATVGGAARRYELVRALQRAGRYVEAREVVERLDFHPSRIGMFSHMTGAQRLAAQIEMARGQVCEELEDYEPARAAYGRALAWAEEARNEDLAFQARMRHAISFSRAARHREAVRHLRQALDHARAHAGPTGEAGHVPAALNNLADAYRKAGEHEAARSCYARVLSIFERHGATSFGRVIASIGLADAARDAGDPAGAVAAYEQALRWSPGTRRGVRDCVMVLLDRLTPDLPEAEELRREVWSLAERDHSATDWTMTFTYERARAARFAHEGRVAEAVDCRRRILRQAIDRGVGPATVRGQTIRLAEELLSSGLPGARQEAFDLLWTARKELLTVAQEPTHRARSRSVISRERRLYDVLLDVLLDGRGTLRLPDERSARHLAFDLHEESKAHAFLMHLAASELPAPPQAPAALLSAEAGLREELAGLDGAAAVGRDRPDRREALVAELNTLWNGLRPYADDYVRVRQVRPATFAELRDRLRTAPDRDDLAFVSYFCGNDTTTVFTYVPAIDQLTIGRVPVPRDRLRRVAERLRHTFNGNPRTFPPTPPLHPRRPGRRSLSFLEELAPELLSFLPQVEGRPLVCVAADGPLHVLPLNALPTADGQPLVRAHALVHVHSASAVLYSMIRHPAAGPGTASGSPPVVFCAGVAAREDDAPEALERDADLLEAAGWQVERLSGTDVTRAEVLRGLAERRTAHLTCHGHFDSQAPMDSGLLLADGRQRPSKAPASTSLLTRLDQLLTVRDFAAAHIDVDLLTLRACSTGLRDDDAQGELEGLTQALLYCGARTLMATLWNVDQTSSRTLLGDFYRRRLARPGEPIWRSLWDAQRHLLDRPEHPSHAHPYHWAGHTLYGDWRQR